MAVKNWKVFVLITLSGLIMCMFIGFILAGSRALLPGHIAFQFTGYGFFCSLLYTTLKFSTTRDYLFVAVIFYLFDVILLGHGNPSKFIIHGSYSLFLVLSIFIYVRKLEQEAQNGFLANVFSLSGIVAFAFLCAILVLTLFPKYKFDYRFLEGQVFTGLLIGMGLGVGFQLYYRYHSRLTAFKEKKTNSVFKVKQ